MTRTVHRILEDVPAGVAARLLVTLLLVLAGPVQAAEDAAPAAAAAS